MIIKFLHKYFFTAAHGLYLLTIGLFRKKDRVRLDVLSNQLGFDARQHKLILPLVKIEEIVPSNAVISISEFGYVDGNSSLYELCVINSLVKKYQPNNILEIGTFDGRSALNMALNINGEGHVYTLDLPKADKANTRFSLLNDEQQYIEKDESGSRINNSSSAKKIIQLSGDSASYNFNELPSTSFIFIDGSHAYDYVMSDSLKCIEKIENGGIIIWHDYGSWIDVTNALNYLYNNNPVFKNMRQIENTSFVLLQVTK